jgi:hypothetical protein
MAAPVSLDELLPEVLIFVPNVPDPVAYRFLREAARKLCQTAKVLRYSPPAISLRTPTPQILPTLVDTEFVEIESARVGDNYLTPVTIDWLDAERPGWDKPGQSSGTASFIVQTGPDNVQVVPPEYAVVGAGAAPLLHLRCVMQPSRGCITIDSELVDLFGTLIGRGAAAQMLMLPGVDFANPSLGAAMYAEFLGKLTSLKTEYTKGQQGARLRTTGVWF